MPLEDIRAWVQFAFVVSGGTLALAAYFQNLRQRRVENALKFITNFKDSLEPDDIAHWAELFVSSSEPAGAGPGEYVTSAGHHSSIGDYFSEGSPDSYAVSRMAESLDVLCHQVLTDGADARTVYYELGQLLETLHRWLGDVRMPEGTTLLHDSFPNIGRFFRRYGKRASKWPSRVYSYVE